ncbi:FAD-binding protein [Granulicella paludicola]|uniref:FAD-binding protein n=1 Tax=Granulicella paludicola TaxID=474951 RepID=UPI0021E08BBA|nr:FAD-binding protein [Granulicella paludicola]
MNKREFLKTSATIATGALLSRFASAEDLMQTSSTPRTNWAGNLTYHADHLYKPTSIEELQQIVVKCPKLRALGSRHSFNAIADSLTNQVSLEHFDSIAVDAAARTVTVGAGVRYGTLAPVIDKQGFALHNLASLPHITVAGAIATATHGSGVHNKNLSSAVSSLELVNADGKLVHLSRAKDGDNFLGTVVALGALGIVTKVTLDLQPRYDMAQLVYRNMSMDQLEHNLEDIMSHDYSVSLFTNWQNDNVNQVWLKYRVAPGEHRAIAPEFYGAKAATRDMHPIDDHSAESCTPQLGVVGPWYERLPHFKMNFTPSSGAEIQTEYFVPRNRGYEAIRAVESLRDKITPHLFITEIRSIAADELWTSMAYQRDSLAIHFTFKPETDAINALVPYIEEKLAPFDARPHWAKVFRVPPAQLAARYPKMDSYKALTRQHDPQGRFRNQFLDTNIFG